MQNKRQDTAAEDTRKFSVLNRLRFHNAARLRVTIYE